MIWEIRYIFHFSRCSFSHRPRKSGYQNKFVSSTEKQKKTLSCFKVKNDHDVMRILSFIKTVMQLLSDIRFFSPIQIGVSFCCNSFHFFFFLCIYMILEIILQLLDFVLNQCVIKNYIVAARVLYNLV